MEFNSKTYQKSDYLVVPKKYMKVYGGKGVTSQQLGENIALNSE